MGLIDKVDVNVNGSGDVLSTLQTYATRILKPNIVDGKNILTQQMVSAKNTKYVIKYDYELEDDITIPKGCILEFDGGGISGAYTVTGTNTGIKAGLIKIFGTDVILDGTWNVADAYPEWFGANAYDDTVDDRIPIQKCVNSFKKTVLTGTQYTLLSNDNGVGINLTRNRHLCSLGLNSYLRSSAAVTKTTLKALNTGITKIINIDYGGSIEDIIIEGYLTDYYNHKDSELCGVNIFFKTRVKLKGVMVRWVSIGFESAGWGIYYEKCEVYFCNVGFYIHGTVVPEPEQQAGNYASMTTNALIGCSVLNASIGAFKLKDTGYSALVNCSCDSIGFYNDTPVRPVEDYSLTNPDGYFGSYLLQNCTTVSLISCGTEQTYKALYLDNVKHCSVLSFIAITKYSLISSSSILSHFFDFMGPKGLEYSGMVIMTDDNGQELLTTDKKYVYYSNYGSIPTRYNAINSVNGLTVDNINYYNSNSDLGIKSLVFNDPIDKVYAYNNQNINPVIANNSIEKVCTISVGGNYGGLKGGTWKDYNGTTKLIIKAESNTTSVSMTSETSGLVIDGFKEVVFENISITIPNKVAFSDTFAIKFKNTKVVFKNCKIAKATNIASNIQTIFYLDNSECECINSKLMSLETVPLFNSAVSGTIEPANYSGSAMIPRGVTMRYTNGYIGKFVSDNIDSTPARAVFHVILNVQTIQDVPLTNQQQTAAIGSTVYNLYDKKLYVWDGTGWKDALGNTASTVYPKVLGAPVAGNLAKFNSTNIEDAGVAPQS